MATGATQQIGAFEDHDGGLKSDDVLFKAPFLPKDRMVEALRERRVQDSGLKSHTSLPSSSSAGTRIASGKTTESAAQANDAARLRRNREVMENIEKTLDNHPEEFSTIPEIGREPNLDDCSQWIFSPASAAAELANISRIMFDMPPMRRFGDWLDEPQQVLSGNSNSYAGCDVDIEGLFGH